MITKARPSNEWSETKRNSSQYSELLIDGEKIDSWIPFSFLNVNISTFLVIAFSCISFLILVFARLTFSPDIDVSEHRLHQIMHRTLFHIYIFDFVSFFLSYHSCIIGPFMWILFTWGRSYAPFFVSSIFWTKFGFFLCSSKELQKMLNDSRTNGKNCITITCDVLRLTWNLTKYSIWMISFLPLAHCCHLIFVFAKAYRAINGTLKKLFTYYTQTHSIYDIINNMIAKIEIKIKLKQLHGIMNSEQWTHSCASIVWERYHIILVVINNSSAFFCWLAFYLVRNIFKRKKQTNYSHTASSFRLPSICRFN